MIACCDIHTLTNHPPAHEDEHCCRHDTNVSCSEHQHWILQRKNKPTEQKRKKAAIFIAEEEEEEEKKAEILWLSTCGCVLPFEPQLTSLHENPTNCTGINVDGAKKHREKEIIYANNRRTSRFELCKSLNHVHIIKSSNKRPGWTYCVCECVSLSVD